MRKRKVESILDDAISKPLLIKKAIGILKSAKSLEDLGKGMMFDFTFSNESNERLPEWEVSFIRTLIKAAQHIGHADEAKDALKFLKGKLTEFGIELFMDSDLDPSEFKMAKSSLLDVLENALVAIKKSKLTKKVTDRYVKYV